MNGAAANFGANVPAMNTSKSAPIRTVRNFCIALKMHRARKTAPWKSVPRPQRVDMMKAALGKLEPRNSSVRLFGVAVDREAVSPRDPVQMALEEICNRFN